MPFLRKDINKYLSKIKKGDKAYKNILFEVTYRHLKNIAWKYVYNKDDVEDVLVEAYLSAFQCIQSFDESRDGFNWLCKIVQHEAYDWNGKNGKLKTQSLTDLHDIKDEEAHFEIRVAQRDEIDRLLAPYPEVDRRIIELHIVDKCSFQEIQEKTGVKRSTAHKRLRKILKELNEKHKKNE